MFFTVKDITFIASVQKQYWVELCSGMIVESNIRSSNILDIVSPLEIRNFGNIVVSITVILL